jgi:hypothetical protein
MARMSLIAWCCSVQALWADVMEYRKSLRALDLTDKYVKWLELRLPSMPTSIERAALHRHLPNPSSTQATRQRCKETKPQRSCEHL